MTSNQTNGSGGGGADLVETGKRLAAFAAVDDNVRANMVVGVGSGSTIAYAVDRLKEKVQQGMKGRAFLRKFVWSDVRAKQHCVGLFSSCSLIIILS